MPQHGQAKKRVVTPADTAGPAIAGGERLAQTVVGESATYDDAWQTLASVRPEQGDHVDGRYVFRLEVTGLAGNDGNAFTATLSLRDRRDARARRPGDHWTTCRRCASPTRPAPPRSPSTFPPTPTSLTIHNFDAASGQVCVRQHLPDGAARGIRPGRMAREHGRAAARGARRHGGDRRQRRPGDPQRPDACSSPTVPAGCCRCGCRPRLPCADQRPVPVADHTPLADCSGLAFDASRSTDPDGDRLRYQLGVRRRRQRGRASPSSTAIPRPAPTAACCASATARRRSATGPSCRSR